MASFCGRRRPPATLAEAVAASTHSPGLPRGSGVCLAQSIRMAHDWHMVCVVSCYGHCPDREPACTSIGTGFVSGGKVRAGGSWASSTLAATGHPVRASRLYPCPGGRDSDLEAGRELVVVGGLLFAYRSEAELRGFEDEVRPFEVRGERTADSWPREEFEMTTFGGPIPIESGVPLCAKRERRPRVTEAGGVPS